MRLVRILLSVLWWTLLPTAVVAQDISYVGGQTGNFLGATTTQTITFSLTNGVASTPAAGDLVIITLCTGSTVDRTLDIETAGAVNYTLLGAELYSNDLFDTNMRVAYRFMPPTPDTQFQFGGGSGNNADGAAWMVHVFRGVAASAIDVVTQTSSAANQNTHLINPPPITPVRPGSWIVVTGCGASTAGGNYSTSGLTDFRTNTAADTNDGSGGSGYTTWTSGAYDHAAFTGGGTDSVDDSWASVVIALRERGVVQGMIGPGIAPARRPR